MDLARCIHGRHPTRAPPWTWYFYGSTTHVISDCPLNLHVRHFLSWVSMGMYLRNYWGNGTIQKKNGYDHLGTIRVSEFWPTNHWIGLRGNWNRKPQPISLVSGDDFPFNQSSDTTLRHSGISNRSGLRYRCPWPPDGVGREPWTLRVGLRRITPWLHSKKATYMII
jgi:hypothetical protein